MVIAPRQAPPDSTAHSLQDYGGARVVRISHRNKAAAREHSHDWPILSLYLMGVYEKIYGEEKVAISGPSAVFHPAGACHANRISDAGLEQIDIEFDPAWLKASRATVRLDRMRCWTMGAPAHAARHLAALVKHGALNENELAGRTADLLALASANDEADGPPWLTFVARALQAEEPPTTNQLARRLDVNPAYLARCYRAAVGEGIHETLRRRRVERAAALLRHSRMPAAEIAVSVGFCDQSHMNRSFRHLLDRTPLQVRAEWFQNVA